MSGQPDRLNAAEPGHGIVSNLMELAIRNAAKIFGLFPDADSGRSGHAACHAKYRLPRSAIEGPPLARPAMLSPAHSQTRRRSFSLLPPGPRLHYDFLNMRLAVSRKSLRAGCYDALICFDPEPGYAST